MKNLQFVSILAGVGCDWLGAGTVGDKDIHA
jgi:hypothetical protein